MTSTKTDIIERLRAVGGESWNNPARIRNEAANEIEQLRAELDALRAKIEAMEKQEPVAKVRVHQTGGNAGLAWSVAPLNDFDSLPLMRDGDRLYALPGAQPMPSVPEGYKIVPTVPTDEMVEACYENWQYGDKSARDIWRDMLAASPKMEEQ